MKKILAFLFIGSKDQREHFVKIVVLMFLTRFFFSSPATYCDVS